VVATTPEDSASPVQDTIIALSYFELMAQSLGVGTLWNGMIKMTMSLVPELRQMLRIPNDHLIGYFMSFGKPAAIYARTVQYRKPLINQIDPLAYHCMGAQS